MKPLLQRSLLPLTFLGLATLGLALGQDRFAGVEITAEPVAGNVHALFGYGGNLAVSVGEDGVLLVDDQFAELEPRIRAAVEDLADDRPRFLVNTHWHGDHTGGNAAFAEGGATIFAHANVRRRLSGDASIGGRVGTDTPAAALPVVTHERGLSIHFNGEEIRLLHFPNAHTDGDTVVWFTGSNVVHLGDLYFDVGYPFIDVDSGGGIRGIVSGVREMLAVLPEDVRIVSGHGRVTGRADLQAYAEMLADVLGRIQEALDDGLPADEIVALKLTADYDERWGGFSFVPPDNFVRSVIRSLTE